MALLVAVVAGGVIITRTAGSDAAGNRSAAPGTAATTGPSATLDTSAATAATTSATAPPTTVAPTTTPSTTTTTRPPHLGLIAGDSGAEVLALQQALSGLGYWNGTPDGAYGGLTSQAVMAFQKVNGLAADGNAGLDTLASVRGAGRPAARTAGGDAIEIDLERQVMLIVRGGAVAHVFNTSTGRSGWETPPGSYAVYRMVDGVDPGPYGSLYRPAYFVGGFALHGAGSIPAYPASHGCARITNAAMDMLWAEGLGPGMPVEVY